ncbi:threonylcarbamoyl-AMP synthase [Candidatus Woesearchaeota archaeon]|jgi:L-threonylcarbamoyladenylate synthase|nr:threonylcarbamoyl-AMP synthase [Candidatus Woesearchaeota archaeon]MBT6044997.1 threonylcarbamoyl-AMP synthase [Candidatus Woesearchaeota archaeon]
MNKFDEALECLKDGKVIIYPSESCYSFGCDAKNKEAVERVHEIKKESNKSLILNVFDSNQADEFGVMNDVAKSLFEEFKGRALTLIIDRKDTYDYLSEEGIAVRVLSNKIANNLVKEFGSAIITTSVNIHGEKPLYDLSSVVGQFGDKVDCIIDSGDLDENVSVSTLFDTRTMKILREGAVSKAEIETFLSDKEDKFLTRD